MTKKRTTDGEGTLRMQVLLRRDEAPELFDALEKITNKFVRRTRMIGLASMGLAVNRGGGQVLLPTSVPAANGQYEPATPAQGPEPPPADELSAAFGAVDSLGL